MKKKIRKLVLSRETLVELDRPLQAVGGRPPWETQTCPENCPWSGANTCATCGPTCETNC